jgi:hypothetical protein
MQRARRHCRFLRRSAQTREAVGMTSYLRFGTITLLLLCTSTMAVAGRLTVAPSDNLVLSGVQGQLIW